MASDTERVFERSIGWCKTGSRDTLRREADTRHTPAEKMLEWPHYAVDAIHRHHSRRRGPHHRPWAASPRQKAETTQSRERSRRSPPRSPPHRATHKPQHTDISRHSNTNTNQNHHRTDAGTRQKTPATTRSTPQTTTSCPPTVRSESHNTHRTTNDHYHSTNHCSKPKPNQHTANTLPSQASTPAGTSPKAPNRCSIA